MTLWEQSPPWALSKMLQAKSKSKTPSGGDSRFAGADTAMLAERPRGALSPPASAPGAIAARSAGRRHGNGRGGKRSRVTGRRWRASRSGMGKGQSGKEDNQDLIVFPNTPIFRGHSPEKITFEYSPRNDSTARLRGGTRQSSRYCSSTHLPLVLAMPDLRPVCQRRGYGVATRRQERDPD